MLSEGAPALIRDACFHALGAGQNEIYCLFLGARSRPPSPGSERKALEAAAIEAAAHRVRVAPVARSSGDPTEAVPRAAEESGARVVIMNGAERRGPLARLRLRRVLRTIRKRLSQERRLIVYA